MTVLKTVLHIGVTQKGQPDYRIDTAALSSLEQAELDALLDQIPKAMEHVVRLWEIYQGEKYQTE